jgi:HD-GYP domain-containing protein (c-di-GMP phosphodiesterase class II)
MDDHINYENIFQLELVLNRIQDFDILLERILLEARKIAHADAGSIYVRETTYDQGTPVEKLAIKYSQNDSLSALLPPGEKLIYSLFSLQIDDKTIAGHCANSRMLVNVPDVYNLDDSAPYTFNPTFDNLSNYKTTYTLAIPLVYSDDRLIGVIQVINSKDEDGNIVPFSKDNESVISYFAIIASIALQRAQSTRGMVLRTVKLSELRDPKETGTHVNRVAGYSVEIYDHWAYLHNVPTVERDKTKDIFRIAAMLHDVGKVAISDTILKKPGRFTEDEYSVMQRHTLYGSSLFANSQTPLDEISYDVALNHHENWDGTGYPGWVDPVTEQPIKMGENGKPLGKKGEEIPLMGRIVALADVFDALCSRRVYKDPWSEEDVLAEIKNMRGSKFDPELTDIFFEIYPSIKRIQEMYQEEPNED